MILEIGIIAGRLISCTLIAYGFARLEAPGKNVLFAILLATLMLPGAVTQIPRFILFNKIGWVNSFLPLIVPTWFGEAYAIFLMRQFFMTIPRELEEAARMDGANLLQILLKVIVPLSWPVLTVVLILSFKDIWNEFFNPLLYLNDITKYPLAVGLAYFNGQFRVQMSLLMAASVVVLLPLLIVFFIAQRAFVEGISLTGMAGR
jgi:ABC-type glycerol-3-phosphate transport system permease component